MLDWVIVVDVSVVVCRITYVKRGG